MASHDAIGPEGLIHSAYSCVGRGYLVVVVGGVLDPGGWEEWRRGGLARPIAEGVAFPAKRHSGNGIAHIAASVSGHQSQMVQIVIGIAPVARHESVTFSRLPLRA